VKMWALEGPTLTFDRGIIEPGSTAGPMTTPCPSFLIEHDRGMVLFDTGPDPAAAVDPVGQYGRDLVEGMGLRFAPEVGIDRQLEAIGVKPADIDFVVVSHLHFDHAGATHLFDKAKIIVGTGEIQWALWPSTSQQYAFRRLDVDRIPRSKWVEVSSDFDMFGDGRLILLTMPGHTPGELSLLVNLDSCSYVLTGDAVHDHAQLDALRALPSDANTSEAVQSLRRLQELRDIRGAKIWIGHDPDDWSRYPHSAEMI
jgi:N-acyl homoserine lactone hydrolase